MPKPTYVGMSDDMKAAFRELVELLLEERWTNQSIVEVLEGCIDTTTDFFAELSELIMDA